MGSRRGQARTAVPGYRHRPHQATSPADRDGGTSGVILLRTVRRAVPVCAGICEATLFRKVINEQLVVTTHASTEIPATRAFWVCTPHPIRSTGVHERIAGPGHPIVTRTPDRRNTEHVTCHTVPHTATWLPYVSPMSHRRGIVCKKGLTASAVSPLVAKCGKEDSNLHDLCGH